MKPFAVTKNEERFAKMTRTFTLGPRHWSLSPRPPPSPAFKNLPPTFCFGAGNSVLIPLPSAKIATMMSSNGRSPIMMNIKDKSPIKKISNAARRGTKLAASAAHKGSQLYE